MSTFDRASYAVCSIPVRLQQDFIILAHNQSEIYLLARANFKKTKMHRCCRISILARTQANIAFEQKQTGCCPMKWSNSIHMISRLQLWCNSARRLSISSHVKQSAVSPSRNADSSSNQPESAATEPKSYPIGRKNKSLPLS